MARTEQQERRLAEFVMSLMGKRVRAVIRGEGPGIRVDGTGEAIPVTSRTVVVGTVVGWERTHYGEAYVDVGGYGRVPVEAVRRARWWHRA